MQVNDHNFITEPKTMILDLIDINDVYESKQKVIRMYVYVWVLSPMWFI